MKLVAALVSGLVAVMLVGVGLIFTPLVIFTASGETQPPTGVVDDIPAALLPIYQRAAAQTCAMPWTVLAAIGKVESDHGRSQAPGVRIGSNFAGAMGPMQFVGPTWGVYGVDADGDGQADVYNPLDAIWGSARDLCANGAGNPDRLASAIWNYNHDDSYVDNVLAIAAGYDAGGVRPESGREVLDTGEKEERVDPNF